jgi:hypothetical protein
MGTTSSVFGNRTVPAAANYPAYQITIQSNVVSDIVLDVAVDGTLDTATLTTLESSYLPAMETGLEGTADCSEVVISKVVEAVTNISSS